MATRRRRVLARAGLCALLAGLPLVGATPGDPTRPFGAEAACWSGAAVRGVSRFTYRDDRSGRLRTFVFLNRDVGAEAPIAVLVWDLAEYNLEKATFLIPSVELSDEPLVEEFIEKIAARSALPARHFPWADR